MYHADHSDHSDKRRLVSCIKFGNMFTTSKLVKSIKGIFLRKVTILRKKRTI